MQNQPPQQELTTRPAKRPPIPQGEHIVTLVSVDPVEVTNLAHIKDPVKDPRVKVTKWAWRFESDEMTQEDGLPYEHTEWTFDAYGSPRANLTILLDQLIPRATKEQKERLNPRVLIGRRWETNIIYRASQTSSGQVAEAQYFKPRPPGDRRPDAAPPEAAKAPVAPPTSLVGTAADVRGLDSVELQARPPAPRVAAPQPPGDPMLDAAQDVFQQGDPDLGNVNTAPTRDPRFGPTAGTDVPH